MILRNTVLWQSVRGTGEAVRDLGFDMTCSSLMHYGCEDTLSW